MLPKRRSRGARGDVDVVTLDSGVGLRIHRPRHTALGPALLWIHGGGYVLGDAAMDDKHCRRLAHELGATVAAVDYRLAPEHPYPTPLHDCYDALRWLTEAPSVDARRVAVAGASAGGGLAAAVAQLAHDRAEIDLAAQVLVYPMLDDRTGHGPDPGRRNRRMWNNTSNRLGWERTWPPPTRTSPCRPADKTSAACLPPGSVWARWTFCTTRRCPMPSGCAPRTFVASSALLTGPFMALMPSRREALLRKPSSQVNSGCCGWPLRTIDARPLRQV